MRFNQARMKKLCDKCKKFPAEVSYTETVNGKTRHFDLCDNCANGLMEKNAGFMDSFFNLDPFREIDQMFEEFLPTPARPRKAGEAQRATNPSPQHAPLLNSKEEKLKELKNKLDELKQEEAIAVMVQDYIKAAEIKKKRERLQKEAEKIINQ